MRNLGLIWRTVRQLTLRQIVYQVIFRLRGRARLHIPATTPQAYFLTTPEPDKPQSYQSGVVTFLNLSRQLTAELDWNYAGFGKLWTYNLNYFDYLNQPDMTVRTGLELICDFMAKTDSLRDGLEPYPTSLRIMNWVQFLSRHQIQNEPINQHLFAQIRLLSHRLDYHLGGNHLLENGFSLLMGALFFRQARWFHKASRLIRQELTNQILADGGHDERSPMYHQIFLDRLLDLRLALQTQSWHNDPDLLDCLTEKATQMLDWINGITFKNGDVPMVNDAAWGIAPTSFQLRKKAERTGIQQSYHPSLLTSSGYRMYRQKRYELFADVGPVGPDHQPGHAHADTFSFVLYVDNQPALVDNSISTYQPGSRRAWERSTAAHNTVTVNESNSSEVWASFRVGRRAGVTLLTDTGTVLTARHDGYRKQGVIHERSWVVEPNCVVITDRLLNAKTEAEAQQPGIARFYVHPDVSIQLVDDFILAGSLKIVVRSETNPTFCVISYAMAEGFNQLRSGHCLEVAFIARLETTLLLSG
ncbi:heparinase [Spirosoma sp. KCTC 42546]|uniref:alginate lyase family protein n=1 Tax=Spirosoma sp. KCTC 42546 TaxID=2520506 RepID=UPI001156D032|nr:alginate lyase family protein [Spirosoma sp. KCTC 42546]QDK82602.1 heparinase [Spirosoma sp. KCTC 42546]